MRIPGKGGLQMTRCWEQRGFEPPGLVWVFCSLDGLGRRASHPASEKSHFGLWNSQERKIGPFAGPRGAPGSPSLNVTSPGPNSSSTTVVRALARSRQDYADNGQRLDARSYQQKKRIERVVTAASPATKPIITSAVPSSRAGQSPRINSPISAIGGGSLGVFGQHMSPD
jgi:hypothetical protein